MPLTIVRSLPDASSYTPLTAYQSQTPSSFTTPVLHFRHDQCKVLVPREDSRRIPIFGGSDVRAGDRDEDGGGDEKDPEVHRGFYCWVTSEKLILVNSSGPVGVEIPYPALTLHAIQRSAAEGVGIYMQISLTPDIANMSNANEYDEDELVELTVCPLVGDAQAPDEELAKSLFKALSDCSALHPDPANLDDEEDDGDEDRIVFERNGDEPRLEGFPGEGGWITADNVDQFRFDDADVVPLGGSLGPGAGTVRPRGHEPIPCADGDKAVEGEDETKWRRTD